MSVLKQQQELSDAEWRKVLQQWVIKVIPICFVKLRFNALERAKRGMSEIMCGSDFTAL